MNKSVAIKYSGKSESEHIKCFKYEVRTNI